ncbi:hypothetical protein PQR02_01630 [Paraburkholderia sediminicola]|uniref:Uncharacterized protein n=1 Tax=Paraburkholderia rhynchosiae TaxID=487049 RepID=A0ACC7N4F9_9BURK
MDLNQFRKISVPLCTASKSFNKVFGIGANKTGTTSLQAIFNILGLNVAPQQEGELHGVQAMKGNLRPLVDYVSKYDAFQDIPFSIKSTYAQLDALFPGSKFVLTYRNADAWFNSLHQFHRKIFGVPDEREIRREDYRSLNYLYPGYVDHMMDLNWTLEVYEEVSLKRNYELFYNPDHYKSIYRERNAEIVRHFSERPSDLLVIDLTQEKDTSRIVKFLGLPDDLITNIPHLNET